MTDKTKVIITDKQKDVKIPTGLRMLVRRCCNAVLHSENFKGSVEVSVSFVNNEQIKELNFKYRDKDKPTDVLSFPTGENGNYTIDRSTGTKILGDIIISVEKAVEQANEYGYDMQREIGRLTVHSMLHLLGYDHETDGVSRINMQEKEEMVLSQLGMSNVACCYALPKDYR